MNKKRMHLTTIGTILFAFWFFLIGMQTTYILLYFTLQNLLLFIAEIIICVLLIKILDLKVKLWEVDK